MATSFTKRIKEQKRLEKRQLKAERKRQREANKALGIPNDGDDLGENAGVIASEPEQTADGELQ